MDENIDGQNRAFIRLLEFAATPGGLFLGLAVALATASTYGATVAAALFLGKAGAGGLPVYYILFAGLSVPISTLFSHWIDRWPRALLMKGMLLAFMLISGALAFALDEGIAGYFAIYLGISLCELLLYSVYYVLLADYFSTEEARNLTSNVAIAMAVGGLLGASLAAWVSTLHHPHDAILGIPFLVGLCLAQLAWLTGRAHPSHAPEPAAEGSMVESLRILPRVMRRYPIIPLLSAAVFLNIVIQCVLEYLAFSIYADSYPDPQRLATFLGAVNAGLNVLGVALAYWVTGPLIRRYGVARLNMLFPVLTLGSFAMLALTRKLPAGILANVNYDSYEYSIDVPIMTVNYKAVPAEHVGRVRVFNDGIVYPIALAVAGLGMVVIEHVTSRADLAVAGLAIAAILLVIHWLIAKAYTRTMGKDKDS